MAAAIVCRIRADDPRAARGRRRGGRRARAAPAAARSTSSRVIAPSGPGAADRGRIDAELAASFRAGGEMRSRARRRRPGRARARARVLPGPAGDGRRGRGTPAPRAPAHPRGSSASTGPVGHRRRRAATRMRLDHAAHEDLDVDQPLVGLDLGDDVAARARASPGCLRQATSVPARHVGAEDGHDELSHRRREHRPDRRRRSSPAAAAPRPPGAWRTGSAPRRCRRARTGPSRS